MEWLMILRELVIDHSFLKCQNWVEITVHTVVIDHSFKKSQNWVEIPVHTVCETLDILHNPSESCFLN